MSRPANDYVGLLGEMTYSSDARKQPDEARRVRFHVGWAKAVDGHTMRPKTLERLTWENLGWRLGDHLGAASDVEIDAAFEAFAEAWRRS